MPEWLDTWFGPAGAALAGGIMLWVGRLETKVASSERAILELRDMLKSLATQGQDGLQRLARIEGRLIVIQNGHKRDGGTKE